ncbi:MAG: inositol monophosphatase [Candidatus Aureabacteria bacterium]|nr:inositol monophosphatase [Candidatus Auribacterota bacterium]
MEVKGKDFIAFIKEIAMEAGEYIYQSINMILDIDFKGANDMVTDVDRRSQKLITERIIASFPDHNITSEEQLNRDKNSMFRWIIDPLDGTTNFVHGYPCFCISIALEYKGKTIAGAVYNPCSREMFFAADGYGAYLNDRSINVSKAKNLETSLLATGFSYAMREGGYLLEEYLKVFCCMLNSCQGIRRNGAAALDLCFVACGRLDGFFEEGLKEWDVAAGNLIIYEAGGIVTDFNGEKICRDSKTFVASNMLIHKELQNITSCFNMMS